MISFLIFSNNSSLKLNLCLERNFVFYKVNNIKKPIDNALKLDIQEKNIKIRYAVSYLYKKIRQLKIIVKY